MMALTGGPSSVMAVLAYVDLIAVTLLMSYQTGLRVAVWMSLLQMGSYELSSELAATHPHLKPVDGTTAVLRVASFLIVAVVVAWCSSINERELRRSRDEVLGLARMAAHLEEVSSTADVGRLLADHLRLSVGFPRAVVLGPEAKGEAVEASRQRREPVLRRSLDPARDPDLVAALPDAVNAVVVPLIADGEHVGTLVAEAGRARGRALAAHTLEVVMQFAAHAALSLRNATLLAEIERFANTDGLTGLANRRVFDEMLVRELARADRTGEPLSLLVLDVDHFKKVNDVHGHQAGDEVLRHVGVALGTVGRITDLPARFGGEEFVILLPACAPDEAVTVAERYRAGIAAPGGPVSVTASAGVATFPLHASDARSLLAAADEALYAAKGDGRDRTVLSRRRTGRRTPLRAPSRV